MPKARHQLVGKRENAPNTSLGRTEAGGGGCADAHVWGETGPRGPLRACLGSALQVLQFQNKRRSPSTLPALSGHRCWPRSRVELRETASVSMISTSGRTGSLHRGVSTVQPLGLSAPSPSPPAMQLDARPEELAPGVRGSSEPGPAPGPLSRRGSPHAAQDRRATHHDHHVPPAALVQLPHHGREVREAIRVEGEVPPGVHVVQVIPLGVLRPAQGPLQPAWEPASWPSTPSQHALPALTRGKWARVMFSTTWRVTAVEE